MRSNVVLGDCVCITLFAFHLRKHVREVSRFIWGVCFKRFPFFFFPYAATPSFFYCTKSVINNVKASTEYVRGFVCVLVK